MGDKRTIARALAGGALSVLAFSAALAADAPKAPETRRVALTASDTPYPPVARVMNLPGRATLNCAAAADGAVSDCKVVGEDPPDWGFGAAALALAPNFNAGPGVAGRRVLAPFAFQLGPDEIGTDPDLKAPGFFIPDAQIKWVDRPTVQDFLLTYPTEAVHHDVEGFVSLACRVEPDGRLNPCAIMTEDPQGLAFDKAALSLITKFRVAPRLADGRPAAGGVVRQGLSWSLH